MSGGSLGICPAEARDLLTSKFRSLFVVGSGGMGSVEVALETQEGGEERIVALKRMLPSAVLDKRQTEMFLREAKLATLLTHPNVVHATSFGQSSGELFLVMEYIEGEPLSRVVERAHEREGLLALPIIAHILAEICEGLHAAHELADDQGRPLNVVHRDVSPHNVMVAYEGSVKLLDFGVAKIEAIDSDGRTKTGEVKGKTAYMSPEQAMGDAIDRRSDIYSLGAVLFEAVSGRKMWGGGTELDVLRRLALEEPPGLDEAAPGTAPVICQLHKRLVARDPTKRPATALEVARELRAFVVSTGTRPDARVVRSVMTRLFAPDIERRRETLRCALEEAAPSASTELRASLAALPNTDVTPVAATRLATPPPRRGTASLGIAAIGVLLAAALGGALWWKGTTPPDKASAGSESAVTATTAAATGSATSPRPKAATSAGSSTTAQPEGLPQDSPAESTPATSASGAPTMSPPRPHLPRGKPRLPSTPTSKPSGPLDVDPSPF